MTASELVTLAEAHADNLQADIRNAKDRIEHIRLTRLAEEARTLATELSSALAASAEV